MISRDQANQASDSLLEPAKENLATKQERLSNRKAIRARKIEALFPAAIASAVVVASIDYFDSPGFSIFFGTAIGSLAGSRHPSDKLPRGCY